MDDETSVAITLVGEMRRLSRLSVEEGDMLEGRYRFLKHRYITLTRIIDPCKKRAPPHGRKKNARWRRCVDNKTKL